MVALAKLEDETAVFDELIPVEGTGEDAAAGENLELCRIFMSLRAIRF